MVCRRPLNPLRERGVALIVALVVVAIAASLASWISLSQQVWMRQSENLRDLDQSLAVTDGALEFAALSLEQEGQRTSDDDLTQPWAKPLPFFPVAGGSVTARIEDAEARFNLNNLFHNGSPDAAQIGVFQRLLIDTGLDPGLATQVVDWITPGSVAQIEQQADSLYLGLKVPYRAASQPFESITELRLVSGFSRVAFQKLRPWVAALPAIAGPTPINVNTAPPPVLAALLPTLAPAAITVFAAARVATPLTDPGQLMARLPPGTATPNIPYSVRSTYFEVILATRFGRLKRYTKALVYRPLGKPAKILWADRYWPA
ncbi:MAG: type II secretion system minor pseudopilin GspK [Acidiferrobacteraceae bacterium]